MLDLGDRKAGASIDFKFNTWNTSDVLTSLAGSPVLSVYKHNDLTETTTGITLTVDFDGRPGCHHVRITTASDATFYAAATDFAVIITAGSVGGNSVAGGVVAHFSIENRNNKVDLWKWQGQTPSGLAFGSVQAITFLHTSNGVAQGGSANTIVLSASESSEDQIFQHCRIMFQDSAFTRARQVVYCTAYNGATKVANVEPPWIGTPPVSGDFYGIIPNGGSNMVRLKGEAINEPISGRFPAEAEVVSDKLDHGLSIPERTALVNALFASFVENGVTFKEAMRYKLAAQIGRTSGPVPGQAGTVTIYDPSGNVARIVATVDAAGYRTEVTVNGADP